MKLFSIMAIGFGLIIVIMLIKYKPMYEVKISDNKIGYIEDKEQFEQTLEDKLVEMNGENANFVTLNEKPEYELKLVSRNKKTDEKQVLTAINENTTVTYKYFAVTLDNQAKAYVSTFEQAAQVVEDIKKQYESEVDLNLQVSEKYTENNEEINVETVEIAETAIEDEVEIIIDNKYTKINGVRIASMPLDSNTTMYISSRYGEISSIRSSAHTGLDIACQTGTDIKTIADGVIISAGYEGAYGYLVRVDHGNGVQTWYAHCSKIYVAVGQTVNAGEIIAAVGSTGNSTGPHLHLEVRINGRAINPQIYMYN